MIPRPASRLGVYVMLAGFCVGISACAGAPSAPESFEPAAAIESVVTTYRGQTVDSSPVVIQSDESLKWEVKVATRLPGAARVSVSVCVMETATSIGVGTCTGYSSTVAELAKRGNVAEFGIRTFQTDGLPRTTTHLYVAVAEGLGPMMPTGVPPQVGQMFGSSRVHAVWILPRNLTFR